MSKFATIDESGNILDIVDISIENKILVEDEEIISSPSLFRYEKSVAGFVRKDESMVKMLQAFLTASIITQEQFDTMTSTL